MALRFSFCASVRVDNRWMPPPTLASQRFSNRPKGGVGLHLSGLTLFFLWSTAALWPITYMRTVQCDGLHLGPQLCVGPPIPASREVARLPYEVTLSAVA